MLAFYPFYWLFARAVLKAIIAGHAVLGTESTNENRCDERHGNKFVRNKIPFHDPPLCFVSICFSPH